jgi:hypothetical protein
MKAAIKAGRRRHHLPPPNPLPPSLQAPHNRTKSAASGPVQLVIASPLRIGRPPWIRPGDSPQHAQTTARTGRRPSGLVGPPNVVPLCMSRWEICFQLASGLNRCREPPVASESPCFTGYDKPKDPPDYAAG